MGHVDLKTLKKTKTLNTVNPEFQKLLAEVSLMMLTPETYYPPGSRMFAITNETAEAKEKDEETGKYSEEPDLFVESLEEAELVTSQLPDGYHMPVLDIDVPCDFIPSTTEGHGHLYFHKQMTWDQMVKLMTVMAEVGLLEKGYVEASKSRAYSAVRLPWVKKGEKFFGKVTHMIPMGHPLYPMGKGVKIPEPLLGKIDFAHDLVFMSVQGTQDPEDPYFTLPESVMVYPGQAGKEYGSVLWSGYYYAEYQSDSKAGPWSGEPASGCVGGCQSAMKKGTTGSGSTQQMLPLSSKELKAIKDKIAAEEAAKIKPVKKKATSKTIKAKDIFFEPLEKKVKVPGTSVTSKPLTDNTIPVVSKEGVILTFVPDSVTHWNGYNPKKAYFKKHGDTAGKVLLTYGEKGDQTSAVVVGVYPNQKACNVTKPSKSTMVSATSEQFGWSEVTVNSIPAPGKYSWPDLNKNMVTVAAEKATPKPEEEKAPKSFGTKFYDKADLTTIVADIYPKMGKPITTHIPTALLTGFEAGVEMMWAKKSLFGNDTLVVLKFEDGDYMYVVVNDGGSGTMKNGLQVGSEPATDTTIKDVETQGSGKSKWQVMKLAVPFPEPAPEFDYKIGAHGIGNHVWVTSDNKALSINPSSIPEAGYKAQKVFFSAQTKQYITYDPTLKKGKIYTLAGTPSDTEYYPKHAEKLFSHTIDHLEAGIFADYVPASYSYKVD